MRGDRRNSPAGRASQDASKAEEAQQRDFFFFRPLLAALFLASSPYLQGGKFVLTVKGEDLGQLDQWWLHAVLAAIGEILEVRSPGFVPAKLSSRSR